MRYEIRITMLSNLLSAGLVSKLWPTNGKDTPNWRSRRVNPWLVERSNVQKVLHVYRRYNANMIVSLRAGNF